MKAHLLTVATILTTIFLPYLIGLLTLPYINLEYKTFLLTWTVGFITLGILFFIICLYILIYLSFNRKN
jgi:hypothetical protein